MHARLETTGAKCLTHEHEHPPTAYQDTVLSSACLMVSIISMTRVPVQSQRPEMFNGVVYIDDESARAKPETRERSTKTYMGKTEHMQSGHSGLAKHRADSFPCVTLAAAQT